MAATPQTLHALHAVLQRPDVWRGDQLAGQGGLGLSSGFSALDTELPGGGWPRGALTELVPASNGVGELALLQPALRECVKQAPLAVLAPPYRPHAPAWAAHLPLERILWIEASGKDIAWAAECLLDSGALGALLVWLPAQTDARVLRRLQLAAEGHAAPAFVFRSLQTLHQASPAPLRLALSGSAEGIQVRILKRRGPPCLRSLSLRVERPVAQNRLAARLTPAPVQHVDQAAWA